MLQGKLSAPATLGGALQGGVGLKGTLAGGGSIHPVYDGATEFTPTESAQTVGTEGKVMLTDLTVDAVPSDYVGSSVARRSSADLAASGATVTAPAGYYAEPASKAVASGSFVITQPLFDKAGGKITPKATVSAGWLDGGQYTGTMLSLDTQTAKSVTPTESPQTAVPAYRWTTGAVVVAAIPSSYVGSAVERRDSADLTASGATVSMPAGYYAESASKSVAGGTEGTPTASKTVSGNTATIAPSVTNAAGYIQGGTHAGSPVTVTASELVSGTYAVTGSGTHDVTAYASASVASATPTNSSDSEYITSGGARKWRYRPKTIVPTAGWAAQHSASNPINGFWATYDAIPTGTAVTPTTSAQTIGGADTMMEGAVTVAAIPTGSATAPSSVSATGASISYGLTNITLSKANVSITPTVTPGYVSSGTAGNATVYLSAPAEFQAETDWHPSTSDQNILAGKILSGTQHIKAVTMTNLDAGNIKDGVTVKIGDASDDDCVASVTGTYTGGGSSVKTATGTFTGNGTRTIDVSCTFEPDIVYFTSDPGTTSSSGTVAAIIVRDMMTATRYRNNSTTNSHYAIPGIADLNSSGSSYSWRATYANSKVTLYCYSSNARGLLTNGRTYTYTFIKWT